MSGKLAVTTLAVGIAMLCAPLGYSARDEYFTGLYGTVVVSPWKCPTRVPCEPPGVAGVALTFSRDGREVAHVTSGTQGGYAVVLDPGPYTVSAPRRGMSGKGIVRDPVAVIAGRLVHRDLQYDTGIR